MAISLIQRLSKLEHLSPDEIQNKICKKQWVNFRDLSVGEIVAMDLKRMYITCDENHAGTLVPLNAPNWIDLSGDIDSSWWFCLEEDWNGSPPCETL